MFLPEMVEIISEPENFRFLNKWDIAQNGDDGMMGGLIKYVIPH